MSKTEPDPFIQRESVESIAVDVVIESASWYALPFDCAEEARAVGRAVVNCLKDSLPQSSALEVTLLLANDEHLQQLNKDFRGMDKPTNTLSFPNLSSEELKQLCKSKSDAVYLGDIALSYNTIAAEAVLQAKDFRDHFLHLVLHSMLHLLGYDHITAADRKRMEALEIAILQDVFGIINPYIMKSYG